MNRTKVEWCTFNSDLYTSNCPLKEATDTNVFEDEEVLIPGEASEPDCSEYVPPASCKRKGATAKCKGGPRKPRAKDHSILLTNLSNSTTRNDIEDIIKPFGIIQKLWLSKDENSDEWERHAFVIYRFKKDAVKAISMLNGYRFDDLILKAEWSKPLTDSN